MNKTDGAMKKGPAPEGVAPMSESEGRYAV